MSNFCCAKCAKILPIGYQLGQPTGYVKHEQERICYNCWAKFEIVWMLEYQKVAFYIERLDPPWENPPFVINYSRTLKFKIEPGEMKFSKHKIGKREMDRTDVWFTGPDGSRWHGYNIGHNQLLRCKRLKRQRKHLTPLPESQYLKQYNYSR